MVGTHTIGYLMVGAHNLHVCHLVVGTLLYCTWRWGPIL